MTLLIRPGRPAILAIALVCLVAADAPPSLGAGPTPMSPASEGAAISAEPRRSRSIAEAHGGRIYAKANPDRGE
jgi:hypothetical protein